MIGSAVLPAAGGGRIGEKQIMKTLYVTDLDGTLLEHTAL